MVAFVITERTGAQRELRFEGSALPEFGVTFGGVHREKLTWYPSNPDASAQSIGSTEDPVAFVGTVDDHLLGTVGEARRLVDLAHSIRKTGRECTLEHDDDIRVGRLAEFRYTPVVAGKMYDYEGLFSVHSDELVRTTIVLDASVFSPETRTDFVGDAIAQLGTGEPQHIDATLLATINDRISGIRTLFADIETALDTPEAFAPEQARQVGSMLTDMQRLSRELRDVAGDVEPTTSNFTVLGALDIINGGAYFSGLMRDTADVVTVVERQREAFARIATLPARRLHAVRAGQSLMSIALQHYGTGLEWHRIAEANRLSTHEVAPGTVLLIPEIQSRPRERRR